MSDKKRPAPSFTRATYPKTDLFPTGATAPLFAAWHPEALAVAALLNMRGRGERYSMGRKPEAPNN